MGKLGPETALASGQAAVANARALTLALPTGDDSYVVELEPQGLSPSDPHVVVVLDGASGEVSYIDDPRNYGFSDKVLNWQHLLHFGVGLGLVWTILVFVSGFLPLLFAITGLTMWWKKRRARHVAVDVEASALAG